MSLPIKNLIGSTTLSSTSTSTSTSTTTTTTTKTSTVFNSTLSLHLTNHRHQPLTIVSATGKFNPRTSKFDSKNRRGSTTSTTTKEEINGDKVKKMNFEGDFDKGIVEDSFADDGFVIPELPGDKPDFWEGPQFDGAGFFFQYMWAFGLVFALVACGIAVATYNDGATDFKETPAYKESVESQSLLEQPESSDSDIFESNPTEEAPTLE